MQEFLAKNKVTVDEQADAKKKPLGRDETISLLKGVDEVFVAKGKKLLHFKMKDAAIEEVLAVALGPTGNLRAPTFRKGKTLVVGFDESAYQKVLA